jgi:hypothetical protein
VLDDASPSPVPYGAAAAVGLEEPLEHRPAAPARCPGLRPRR